MSLSLAQKEYQLQKQEAMAQLCREQLSKTEAAIAQKEAAMAALAQELAALRDRLALDQSALKEAEACVESCRQSLAAPASAEAPTEAAAKASSGKVWGVSDCHSYFRHSGAWAQEATESGSYGICITPTKGSRATLPVRLYDGREAQVSSGRYEVAKTISVGDTLYMGDKKRQTVFKGIVTGQSVQGLFRSADPSINSFRRRVGERCVAMGKLSSNVNPLEDEVEIMWEVRWETVGPLTEEWKEYICFSDFSKTVRSLSGAPPA